jgi:hypothetical protein
MNITRLTLIALACAAAPMAARADIGIGINIGVPEVVVRSQPPPDMEEKVPMSPGSGYIWIRGHWSWHHENWQWFHGHWEYIAQPGQEWLPGYWIQRSGGWVWMEGHYVAQPAPQNAPPGAQVEVIAPEPPPVPIFETVPVAPGPDYFWIGGHWHWNHGWVWVGGRFDRHPHYHPGAGWEAGHWDRRGGSWVWFDGHWR